MRFRDLQGTLGGSWDLPKTASDHRKRSQNDKNPENDSKWTHIGRNGLRIRPFEAHSHFQSIANPPRPQIPPEKLKNRHFPKNRKIRKSGNPPGSAAMGGAPLNNPKSLQHSLQMQQSTDVSVYREKDSAHTHTQEQGYLACVSYV